jgi:hypothetical protein
LRVTIASLRERRIILDILELDSGINIGNRFV